MTNATPHIHMPLLNEEPFQAMRQDSPREVLLSVENVSYGYSDKGLVLEDASLTVEAGTITCIIGGNGSGKSTLAKLCCGLLSPTQGNITLLGTPVDKNTDLAFLADNIGLVMQDPEEQLVNGIVEADVAFGPCNLGLPQDVIRQRVSDSLYAVNLSDLAKSEVSTLSGGQKQRLAIAGALALQPRVLIMDEATSMIDPVGAARVRAIARELANRGIGVIMITHDMGEAAMADQVIALSNGKIAACGTPREVLENQPLMQAAGLLPIWRERNRAERSEEAEQAETQVAFQDVSFSYEPTARTILSHINLDVPKGTIWGIAGASGCGKSTLLLQINGLLEPTEGTVLTLGMNTSDKVKAKRIRRHTAFMMQYPQRQLFAKNVYEDVAFGPRNLGWSNHRVEEVVATAMRQAGLDESLANRNPFHLSGGQQRKAALAGVLAMRPKVLILDEPTAGLDPEGRAELISLLIQLVEHGITIVLSSHNLEDLYRLCDSVAILKDGEVLAAGEARAILQDEALMRDAGLLA